MVNSKSLIYYKQDNSVKPTDDTTPLSCTFVLTEIIICSFYD